MEASSSTRRRAGGRVSGAMFSTRRGAITTAVVAALLAGILLFVFVQNYKKSGTAGGRQHAGVRRVRVHPERHAGQRDRVRS